MLKNPPDHTLPFALAIVTIDILLAVPVRQLARQLLSRTSAADTWPCPKSSFALWSSPASRHPHPPPPPPFIETTTTDNLYRICLSIQKWFVLAPFFLRSSIRYQTVRVRELLSKYWKLKKTNCKKCRASCKFTLLTSPISTWTKNIRLMAFGLKIFQKSCDPVNSVP